MIRKHFMAAAVMIAAFLLRIAQLPIEHIPLGDNLNYWIITDHLLHGRGLMFPDPVLGRQRAFFPPLYPVLLAATALNPVAIIALNFIFDIASAAAMVWTGRLLEARRPAIAAAAIYLFWPTNVILDAFPQKEGLVAALCLTCAALALSRRWRLLGLAWGLLLLSQPGLAPLPALFVAFTLPRSEWLKSLHALPVAAAVLLPWWIRNAIVFHAFVPLTTAAGFSLWIGSLPGSSGTWVTPPARFAIGEIAGNRAAMREALGFIAAAPFSAIAHALAKLAHAFVDNSWPGRAFIISASRPKVTVLPVFAAVLLANWTAATSAVVLRGKAGRLLLACLVQLIAIQSWFEVAERHRYFLTPFLLLNAAIAVMPILRRPMFRPMRAASARCCT